MVMPLCGTFLYGGVVPEEDIDRSSGSWILADLSGADPEPGEGRPARQLDPLCDNRLVGLRPALRIVPPCLLLKATDPNRAEISEARLELDKDLLAVLHGGDELTLERTAAGGIGVSIVRHGQIVAAVGALRGALPRQTGIRVTRPDWHLADTLPSAEQWIDVSIDGRVVRLREGEFADVGNYTVAVIRRYYVDEPGDDESVAISLNGTCDPAAAARSARLLIRANAGLVMG